MFYITKAGWIAVNHRLCLLLFQIGYYSMYIIVQSVCTLKEKRPCAVTDTGTPVCKISNGGLALAQNHFGNVKSSDQWLPVISLLVLG